MTWINAPVCERCWLEREGKWETSGDDPELSRLIEVRQPVRMANPVDGVFRIENCHFCGWPTFTGIYQRTEA